MIIHFSHLLLKNILKYLKNIDRICFTLVCKRFYLERYSYLEIKITQLLSSGLKPIEYYKSNRYPLSGYKNSLIQSIQNYTLDFENNNNNESAATINSNNRHPIRYHYQISLLELSSSLPKNVTHLSFTNGFNERLPTDGWIPNTVTHICLPYSFNQPLLPNTFPSGLQYLSLGNNFDQPLTPQVLPDSITTLVMGEVYSHVIPRDALPASLISLVLPRRYNLPLIPGALPAKLQRIRFGTIYNCRLLPGVLPAELRSITFGTYFQMELRPGDIPPEVIELKLPIGYRRPLVEGSIPSSVTKLNLPYYGSANTILPRGNSSITKLNLSGKSTSVPNNFIPNTVESLTTDCFITTGFPPGLKTLKLESVIVSFDVGQLPPSLTRLDIKSYLSLHWKGEDLPNLKRLTLQVFQKGSVFPRSITHLTFKMMSQELETGSLPPCLTHLELGNYYTHSIPPSLLPQSLVHLGLGSKFDHPLPLPSTSSLTSLAITNNFVGQVPQSITTLILRESMFIKLREILKQLNHPHLPITSSLKIITHDFIIVNIRKLDVNNFIILNESNFIGSIVTFEKLTQSNYLNLFIFKK